jgi:hypothetical protein
MDTMVADNNIGLWMDDIYVEVSCSSDNFGRSKSSAKSLAVGAAVSLMAAISMI